MGSECHAGFRISASLPNAKQPQSSNSRLVQIHAGQRRRADAQRLRSGWSELGFVDGVEQEAVGPEVAFVGHEDDAGHVVEVMVIGLLFKRGRLVDAARGENGVEAGIEFCNGLHTQRMVDADDHFFTHPSVGVEIPVEVGDVLHGVIHIVGEVDEMEVCLRDKAIGEEVVCDESAPGFPIMAIRAVDHHDGNDGHFSGLHEGENLKALVVRSKSAREEGEGAGLLGEV